MDLAFVGFRSRSSSSSFAAAAIVTTLTSAARSRGDCLRGRDGTRDREQAHAVGGVDVVVAVVVALELVLVPVPAVVDSPG